MRRLAVFLVFFVLVFVSFHFLHAQSSSRSCVNKKLCAEMIRKGKEAYMRGRYLEAKGYFRRAIQADPSSKEAWVGYDLCVIYGLAKKVEKNVGYLEPKAPKVEEKGPPVPQPKKEEGFVIEEDEGC